MTWSRRGNQKYFYACEQVSGRRRRIYLGRGASAALAVLEMEIKRRERTQRQVEEKLNPNQPSEEHRQVVAVCQQLRHELHMELHAAGFRRHDRGQWRVKHGNNISKQH